MIITFELKDFVALTFEIFKNIFTFFLSHCFSHVINIDMMIKFKFLF
jgi:hypothetical protein